MTQRPKWERPIQIFDPVAPSVAPQPGTPITEYVPDPRERLQMFDPVEPTVGESDTAFTPQEMSYLRQLIGRVGRDQASRILNDLLQER